MWTVVRIAAVIVFFVGTAGRAAAAHDLVGSWSGTLSRSGVPLAVVITFRRVESGGYAGTFTSEGQGIMEYPLDAVTASGAHVAFALGGGDIRLSGTIRGETMSGSFLGGEGTGTFVLRRAAPRALPYRAEEVSFVSRGAVLRGTLCIPNGSGPHPAVVLLHGSGPQTRWGTNRFIADRLARRGIAALAYDKRGSGSSTGDWRTVGYDVLADDAIAGMALMAKRPEIDPTKIGIWGHSQGGFIAPLIARRSGRVAFIVAADSNASCNREQDLLRVENGIRDNGWTGKDGAAALTLFEHFLRVASAGGAGYDDLAREMQRDKVRPWVDWMAIPPRGSWLYRWYPLVASYDSRTYWKTVRVPVLLVYGERDELSDVHGSIAAIGTLVRNAGGPPVTSIVLPGAPHTLRIAPANGPPFFWSHLAQGYPAAEIDWIGAVTREHPAATPRSS